MKIEASVSPAITRFSAVLCWAALLLVMAASVPAQQGPVLQSEPPSVEPTAPPLIQLSAPDDSAFSMPDPTQGLVHLDVTVTDAAGKAVSRLSAGDFKLLDNEREREIVTFQRVDAGSDSSEVVLVIDELNMVPRANSDDGRTTDDPRDQAKAKEKLAYSEAMRESRTFLLANGGRLQSPTIVYRLTADGLFVTPHASIDGNELARELENPKSQDRIWSPSQVARDIGDMTKGGAVSWRVTHSIVALGSIAIEERRKPGRKLLFWIGNGWQIEGRKAEGLADLSVELLTRMREARIAVWGSSEWPVFDADGRAIPVEDFADKQFIGGVQSKGAFDPTDLRFLSLPVIAIRSGGGMITVSRNLASAIEERVRDAASFYALTFDPPRTSVVDEYHRLDVVVGMPGLTAHTYLGYYDQPVFYDQLPVRQPTRVKTLQDAIARSHGMAEGDFASQLQGMELTERLSTERLLELQKQVHGKKAREALEVLADESVFLRPPEEEILSTPKPDMATQKQILLRTVDYVQTSIPKFPDIFATRTTVQYHGPTEKEQTWKTATSDEPLQQGEVEHSEIRIRNGREVVEQVSRKHVPDKAGGQKLQTIGTFGPILVTVVTAATSSKSEIKWSRWEKGTDGALAVFQYRVPQETPLFSAEFCCLPIDYAYVPFKKNAPFHGEIAVNPATGAIMRLTIQADLQWRLPLHRSDVMVEYAPVVRGTRTFVCPSRSVSLARQRRIAVIHEWGEAFKAYAPFEVILNEMRFEKYRIFGSTSRILPDFTEVEEKQ